MKELKETLSVVVPCFNEEEALPLFYDELIKVIKTMDIDYEIVLVNDGSKDDTLKIFLELSKKDKKVKYISFSRNFGKEAAIYAGFKNTTGDYVVTMDADMQDPPYLLPQMLNILRTEDYDSVATRRENRTGESRVRSFFARNFYRIINSISDADIVDGARDYRLMKRHMVDIIIKMSEHNRFSKGMFGWTGFKTKWLAFDNVERVAGTTSWSFFGLFKYAIQGIVCYSNVPLSISFVFAFVLFIWAFILFISSCIHGFYSIYTILWLMLLIGSIILLCIGILGMYLGNVYNETKNRPIYIVSKTNIKEIKL